MASKSPNRHWKTTDWKANGQLKTLEKEQAHLIKSFSRHLNELEGDTKQNSDSRRCLWMFLRDVRQLGRQPTTVKVTIKTKVI